MGRLVALSNDTTVAGRLSLITQARNLVDRQSSNFFSLAELTELVNQELPETYDHLTAAYGSKYFFKQSTINLVLGTSDYALPSDFFKLWRVEVQLTLSDGFHWVDVLRYDVAMENVLNNYPVGFPTQLMTPLRYNTRGADPGNAATVGVYNIHFVPYPYINNQTVRISYAPICPLLVNPSDVFDFIDGWESCVVYGVAARMRVKEEKDPTFFLQERQRQLERLDEMTERDATQAEQIHDTEAERYGSSGYPY